MIDAGITYLTQHEVENNDQLKNGFTEYTCVKTHRLSGISREIKIYCRNVIDLHKLIHHWNKRGRNKYEVK